ncbi:hypothetical protein E8L99_16510 [Phreatobacter aquaticus]|uniref:Phage tail tape measure protein n=1 Tax=Phreatobacter aquaticus TaxID=2570229 RepID=A0A4D7QPQ6_9HYPH|nr:hypothetical protein [Phreatobacter aquaticus]QCK87244.1 hypothetical protein E8L99_16510 [Phreatobacter aquaticus]
MSNPSVTATVSAVDNATAVFLKVAQEAKRLSDAFKQIGAANIQIGGIDQAASKVGALNTALGHTVTMQSRLASGFRAIGTSVGASLGGVIASLPVQMARVAREMDTIRTDLNVFGDVSGPDLARAEAIARNSRALTPEGYAGNMRGIMELIKAGIPQASAASALDHVQMYARMTGQPMAKAAEELAQIVFMQRQVRAETERTVGEGRNRRTYRVGDQIPVELATSNEVQTAFTETSGRLLRVNRLAPGGMQQTAQFYKFAQPAAHGFQVPADQLDAMGIALARNGIMGAEAGNALRSGWARLASPRGPGRTALAANGIRWEDVVSIDPTLINARGFNSALESRIGRLSPQHRRRFEADFAKYQADLATARALQDPEARKNAENAALEAQRERLGASLQATGDRRFSDRAKQQNFLSTYMSNAATQVDLIKMIRQLKEKGAGIGAFNNIFGQEMGSRLFAMPIEQLDSIQGELEKQRAAEVFAEARRKLFEAFTTSLNDLGSATNSFLDRITKPFTDVLTPMFNRAAAGLKSLTGSLTDTQAMALGAGSVIAGLATSIGLLRGAVALLGLGGAGAGAAGGIGAAAGAAGVAISGLIGWIGGLGVAASLVAERLRVALEPTIRRDIEARNNVPNPGAAIGDQPDLALRQGTVDENRRWREANQRRSADRDFYGPDSPHTPNYTPSRDPVGDAVATFVPAALRLFRDTLFPQPGRAGLWEMGGGGSPARIPSTIPNLDPADYERSYRAQRERDRDPEGARGRAFNRVHGDTPQSSVSVTGTAEVRNEVKVSVEAGAMFAVHVAQIARDAVMPLINGVNTGRGMGGSQGVSAPGATATPSTGVQ